MKLLLLRPHLSFELGVRVGLDGHRDGGADATARRAPGKSTADPSGVGDVGAEL